MGLDWSYVLVIASFFYRSILLELDMESDWFCILVFILKNFYQSVLSGLGIEPNWFYILVLIRKDFLFRIMNCIEVILWGSSHFSGSTFRPRLDQQLQHVGRFAVPINYSTVGAEFTRATMANFQASLDDANDRPQLHIFLLGDNNFRNSNFPQLQNSRVEALFWEATQSLYLNPNANLIFIGLMPSPSRFEALWPRFAHVNAYLACLGADIPRAHFCPTTFLLNRQDWVHAYFQDGIHLNEHGTQLLVEAVTASICDILPAYF